MKGSHDCFVPFTCRLFLVQVVEHLPHGRQECGLSNIVNAMASDGLATPSARWLAASFSRNNLGHVSISDRALIEISRKASKPHDLFLELYGRNEIWQTPQQQCCSCACQIPKRLDNLHYQSCHFETSRTLTITRLFWYWNGSLSSAPGR